MSSQVRTLSVFEFARFLLNFSRTHMIVISNPQIFKFYNGLMSFKVRAELVQKKV